MDISGPVRTTLRQLATSAAALPATTAVTPDAYSLLRQGGRRIVRAVLFPEEPLVELPALLLGDSPILLADDGIHAGARPAHRWLVLAGLLRLLPRVAREQRWKWADGLRRQVRSWVEKPEQLLATRDGGAAAFLWQYWLLWLAGKQLGIKTPDMVLAGLWRRGAGSQPRGEAAAPLQAPAQGSIDAFTYDELCALHAGFNVVVMGQDWDRMKTLERAVAWHVANTQPDHTTSEPWALAAFASLDETGTFAPQQLHDATASAGTVADGDMRLVLLADALLTQEAAAGA